MYGSVNRAFPYIQYYKLIEWDRRQNNEVLKYLNKTYFLKQIHLFVNFVNLGNLCKLFRFQTIQVSPAKWLIGNALKIPLGIYIHPLYNCYNNSTKSITDTNGNSLLYFICYYYEQHNWSLAKERCSQI